ncbi:MAG TPA: caspase family protein [Anaerolineales bacterium]|nr:caspase family protein [Anaerolineales bacterium]
MSGKFALIIGNTEYTDPGLAQLAAPGKDAEDFARVLKDQAMCAFDDVRVLSNPFSSSVIETIDEFFDQKKPDDLLVLYFSGHGVRDELGALYLAVRNTNRFRLRSTAVKSDFIREAMDQSRSRRQVLILDCCNSGAFAQGTKAATGVSIGTASAFEAGYGRVILTASDSTQFAWEGNRVIGDTDNSLFTHFLVKGLEGEADLDGDGHITVDELYDYAYENVKLATPKQTPSKFSSKQQGEIILRQITRIEDIKPVSLPDDLIEATEDSRTFVREGAVQQLENLLKGKNLGLARSARETLERIEKEDDSRRVSQTATQALASIRQAEQLALQKAEEERLAAKNADAQQRTKQDAEHLLEQKQRTETEQKAERLAVLKAKEERLTPEKESAEPTAETQEAENLPAGKVNIDMIIGRLKSVFVFDLKRQRPKPIFVAAGLTALLIVMWISLPQLVFLSSNSASEQEIFSATPSVKVMNVDFTATSLSLNGIAFDLDVKTNSLSQNQPYQVIVYLRRANSADLKASRSFATMISPYIAKDGTVSVYTNLVPSHTNSMWHVKLFMPYFAIGASDLPDGTSPLVFYVELYDKDFDRLAASSSIPFTYTR